MQYCCMKLNHLSSWSVEYFSFVAVLALSQAGRLRLEHRLFLWPNKKIFLIIEEDIDCMQTPAVYTLVFWLTFFSCSMEPKLHWSRLVTMYLDGISLFSGKLIFLLWSSIAGFNPTSGCTSIVRMQVPETSSVSLELLMIVGKLVFGAQLFYTSFAKRHNTAVISVHSNFLPALAFVIKVAHKMNLHELHHHLVVMARTSPICCRYGFGFTFVLSSDEQEIFGPTLPRRKVCVRFKALF